MSLKPALVKARIASFSIWAALSALQAAPRSASASARTSASSALSAVSVNVTGRSTAAAAGLFDFAMVAISDVGRPAGIDDLANRVRIARLAHTGRDREQSSRTFYKRGRTRPEACKHHTQAGAHGRGPGGRQ